jgi:S-adenosylmethionine/arginine decarboxylase-like enzyme
VAHLTGCSPEQAHAAVEAVKAGEPADPDEALEVVARAMSAVRRVDLRDRIDLREISEDHSQIT